MMPSVGKSGLWFYPDTLGVHRLWSIYGETRDQGDLIKGEVHWSRKDMALTHWGLLGWKSATDLPVFLPASRVERPQ
jgi:hypothetical protein